jgi:hypothetical protein
MKFTDNTVEVLKNFASINQNILFEAGTEIATVSPQRTVLAKAKLNEQIPQEFAIYDLNRFLGYISRFNDPEYNFDAGCMEITNKYKTGRYVFANASLIQSPPKKNLEVKDPEISFNLKADDLKEVLGDAAVLGLPEVAVEGVNGEIFLSAIDSKDDSSDRTRIKVGATGDKEFRMIFKTENFKMLERDYAVLISTKGISHFSSNDVEYFIATEKNSTYDT